MTAEDKKNINAVVKSLKDNRFNTVEFVKDAASAVKAVLDILPPKPVVDMGGTMTMRQIGIRDILIERGYLKLMQPGLPLNDMRQNGDILLSSCNAVTLDGKLVNIDGTGNRVAKMIFGPPKIILIIGQNKIVRNADEAINRIKTVIAPFHGMTMGIKAPCAADGKCHDCNSPDRICNITTIIEKQPRVTEFAIFIVGQDLGLGWDPEWPEKRKERIAAAYRAAWEQERASFKQPRPS